MKRLLALLSILLLLFGCASNGTAQATQQEKAKPAQQPVGADRDSHGCIGSAGYVWCEEENKCYRPWEESCTKQLEVSKQEEKSYTCSLSLNPETIYAGEATEVSFAVSAKGGVKFTYNCGDEVREISTGGLTGGSRLCQFGTPGEQAVWIKADGTLCAQQTLTVLPRNGKPKGCNVSVLERNLADYYYKMRVEWEGFDAPVKLSWVCDGTNRTNTYLEDPVLGLQKYEIIDCKFSGRPKRDFIFVSVNGIGCGQVSTR
ncbi:MAG: hypothetical protein N3E51_04385 [Candidatus Micrarchaeota archaeon]|nr:hypothetical protein [Candidatus Micrarchaeota archaeon]